MVGRILYLKNNHIPPMKTDLKSEYLSFGSYDGISVSDNVFETNKSDLLKIWLQSVKETFEMKGGYSSQAMYLFSDANQETDKAFWSNSIYSILFLITIQLNKRDDNLEKVSKKIEDQIKRFCENMDIPAITASYLMLDENDVLLAVKCNNYKLGKIITSSFHNKDNGIVISKNIYYVSYSFTITGIKETENGSKLDGLPDYCHIQLVERYPGAIKEILESSNLKDAMDKENYTIFGRDDEILRFKPKSWSSILSLYQSGGLFCNNDDYRKRMLSVSTRFLCKVQEKIIFGDGKISYESDDKDKKKDTICNQLRKKIEYLYQNNIKKICNDQDNVLFYNSCACYKSIWQILNSIEKFETKIFPDYIYISIFAPLTMLIEKIAKKGDMNFEDKSRIVFTENIDEIYLFLAAINQMSQNLIRAERQFMQLPELNANCYNIPIKLHSFYAAFVDDVKNYLNRNFGTGKRYEFTLYPGMNEQLNVTRVFYSSQDSKRLFLMKIPEKQVFDLNHLMICLCHEVGHFVGSNLRQRERRYETIKRAISRMICLHIYTNDKLKKFITEDGLNYLLDHTYKYINKYIDMQRDNATQISKYACDTVLHSENLKPIIMQGVNFFIIDCIENPDEKFDFIFVRYIEKYSVNGPNPSIKKIEKEKKEYDDSICSYFFTIQSNINSGKAAITVHNMITQLFTLTKECFADLISILVLDLEFKDYCRSIFKSLFEYDIKEIVSSDLVIRIALVAVTMSVELEDQNDEICYKNRWNANDVMIWRDEETNENVKDFLGKVWEFLCYAYQSYRNEDGSYVQNDSAFIRLKDVEADSVLSVFRDYELLYYLYRYLCDCRLYFEKNINEKSELEQLEIKDRFKKLIGDGTILEKINCINSVNSKYDESIRKRVQKVLSNVAD